MQTCQEGHPILNYFESLSPEKLLTIRQSFDRTEGMISFDESVLLYILASKVNSGCIIEVGSYRGRSSVFLGKGSLDGANIQVYAIDPHKNFIGVLGGVFGPKDRTVFYRTMLENGCSEIVSLINLSSEVFSSSWIEPISLLWIDGDHSYDGVKKDFECWAPHLQDNAAIAFDDATDPSLGPIKLIDELISSKRFEKVISVGKVVVIQKCNKINLLGSL
jgi:predicted O-methyltransferase YrrM